jgi:hypothetical protein
MNVLTVGENLEYMTRGGMCCLLLTTTI